MTLRQFIIAPLFASVLAGCGGGEPTITDPSKLQPLTEAEKSEIIKQDEQVQNDESKVFDTKAKAK